MDDNVIGVSPSQEKKSTGGKAGLGEGARLDNGEFSQRHDEYERPMGTQVEASGGQVDVQG